MTIMSTIAQQWIDKGKEQGLQQKAYTAVIKVLEARFGVAPQSMTETLARITQEAVSSFSAPSTPPRETMG